MEQYIEAFDNCLERLKAGEQLESILADYPQLANELRPMLEMGNVLKRSYYPVAEVSAAQARVLPKIEAAIQSSAGAGFAGSGLIAGVLIILLIGGMIAFNLFASSSASPTATPLVEETEASTETLVEATADSTASLVEASEVPTLATTITVEGAVEAINGNVISIFGMDFTLAPNDPLLTVIQLGDVIRIEGEYQDVILVVISINFVNVDVTVQNGQVWRDSGNCNNPPPPWANANGWRRRCEGGGGNGNGNGNGRGSGRS